MAEAALAVEATDSGQANVKRESHDSLFVCCIFPFVGLVVAWLLDPQ